MIKRHARELSGILLRIVALPTSVHHLAADALIPKNESLNGVFFYSHRLGAFPFFFCFFFRFIQKNVRGSCPRLIRRIRGQNSPRNLTYTKVHGCRPPTRPKQLDGNSRQYRRSVLLCFSMHHFSGIIQDTGTLRGSLKIVFWQRHTNQLKLQ